MCAWGLANNYINTYWNNYTLRLSDKQQYHLIKISIDNPLQSGTCCSLCHWTPRRLACLLVLGRDHSMPPPFASRSSTAKGSCLLTLQRRSGITLFNGIEIKTLFDISDSWNEVFRKHTSNIWLQITLHILIIVIILWYSLIIQEVSQKKTHRQ